MDQTRSQRQTRPEPRPYGVPQIDVLKDPAEPVLAEEARQIHEAAVRFEHASAQELLEWALERFHPRMAISAAGGVDGMALIDMAWRINPQVRVFTLDTGRLPAETYALFEEVRERYGIEVEFEFPERDALEELIRAHGPNLMYRGVDLRVACCNVRKVEPLKRKLSTLDAWVTGLRREQWRTRRSVAKVELDVDHGGIVKLNPFADWTLGRVWAYVREHEVPYHELFDHGYSSIGCAPCTRPVMPGEPERAGRWWWEGTTDKECGIHCSVQLLGSKTDREREAEGGVEMSADGITFRPDDLPNDVFDQIRSAGGTRWQELDEETRTRGVGKLRLAGVYDDRQEPHFMLRTRIPGGVLTAGQLETIAGVVRDFAVKPGGEEGPERFAEITTRQDLQIHWLRFEDLPQIWDRYDRVGISTSHACGDALRNVTACPVSGVDRSGLIDTRPIVDALGRFTFDEPELTARLPRKFKIVVTGCPTDCTVARINDLVFTPALRDGVIGFNVHVGGGLSDSPRLASALDLFVTAEQVVDTARATLETFVAHGNFQEKAVNRFRIVVHELGAERVEQEIRTRLGFDAPGAGEDLSSWRAEDHLGLHADAGGRHYVGLNVPLGRLSDSELFELARLAREHGDGGVRLTQRQNLVLTGVAQPDALLATELVASRLKPEPDPFERAVVACTSAPFCKFAILNVKEYGARLVEHLRAEVPREVWPSLRGLRLHVSGCKASCAQIQTAHIGLRATMTKDEEAYQDAFDVALGGDVGAGRLGEWAALEVPARAAFERIASALATIDGHGLAELTWDGEREER